MNSENIFMVEEDIDGGYTARAHGHSIFTEAETWDALKVAVEDVVRVHFEDNNRPNVVPLHLVKDEALAA